jgi:hypothetical protein
MRTIDPLVADVTTLDAICAAVGPPSEIGRQSIVSIDHMIVFVYPAPAAVARIPSV